MSHGSRQNTKFLGNLEPNFGINWPKKRCFTFEILWDMGSIIPTHECDTRWFVSTSCFFRSKITSWMALTRKFYLDILMDLLILSKTPMIGPEETPIMIYSRDILKYPSQVPRWDAVFICFPMSILFFMMKHPIVFHGVFPCCFIRFYPQNFPRVQLRCRAHHLWIAWLPPSRPSFRLQSATRSRSVGSVGSVRSGKAKLSHVSSVTCRFGVIYGWYMGDIWVISCLPWNRIVVDLCPRWSLVGTVGTPKVQELSSKLCHEKSKKSDNALTPRRSAPVVCCARPGLLQSIAAQASQVPFLDFWNGGDIPR